MADIKPFPFERLPKISRQDASLLEALQGFLPRIRFTQELGRSIKQLISKELGIGFSYRREKVSIVSVADSLRKFSDPGVYLILGMAPLDQKAVLELDPFLSHLVVDKLLGGPGEPLTSTRPLTEIEQGVLSYLLLKVLFHIYEKTGETARVHLRLEGIRFSPREILPSVEEKEKGALMTFRLTIGDRAGYARLILPDPFVHRGLVDPLQAVEEMGERDQNYFSARLRNLGFVGTELWVELGRTNLTVGEIKSLEPGDVVLLEKTQARIQGGRLEGHLPVRVGRGESGSFRGRVISEAGRIQLRVEEMDLEA